eukprot:gene4498-biopygen916
MNTVRSRMRSRQPAIRHTPNRVRQPSSPVRDLALQQQHLRAGVRVRLRLGRRRLPEDAVDARDLLAPRHALLRVQRTRAGRGPHDRIQRNGRGPDAGSAVTPNRDHRTLARAWRGRGAGYRHLLAWGGAGVARAWRGRGAGMARAWRGHGAGVACDPRGRGGRAGWGTIGAPAIIHTHSCSE